MELSKRHYDALKALRLIRENTLTSVEIAKETGLTVADIDNMRFGLQDKFPYIYKKQVLNKSLLTRAIEAISDLYKNNGAWSLDSLYIADNYVNLAVRKDGANKPDKYIYQYYPYEGEGALYPYETWENLTHRAPDSHFYEALDEAGIAVSYFALCDYLTKVVHLYVHALPYASTTGSGEGAWLQYETKWGYKISNIEKVEEGDLYSIQCFHRSLQAEDLIRGIDTAYLLYDYKEERILSYFMDTTFEESENGIYCAEIPQPIRLDALPIISMDSYLDLQLLHR